MTVEEASEMSGQAEAPVETANEAPVETTPDSQEGGVPEATTPEEPTPSAKETELAERFNEITAREKVLRDGEERAKSEREKANSELEEFQRIKSLFDTDPVKGIEAMGRSFNEVAERVLNDDEPTAEHKVDRLRAEWEAEKQQKSEAAATEAAQQEEAKARAEVEEKTRLLTAAKDKVRTVVEEGGDSYELIKSQEAYDLVFDVAADHWEKTKTALPWEEAAQKVEDHLTAEIEKALSTSRFKGKYVKAPEAPAKTEDEEAHEASNYYARQLIKDKYSSTLSSQMSSEGGAAPEKSVWKSDEESKDYLAAKLRKMMEA